MGFLRTAGNVRQYRLRLPGPTPVPDRVRRAAAEDVLNHRGSEFRDILAEANALAQPLFGTENAILFFASSGTGMMEAALANVLEPGDWVLVMRNGQWGERFAAIAAAYGANVDSLEFPWGEPPYPDAIARKLKTNDYKAVLITHNESSTGVVADVEAIAALTAETPTLLIVDAVSSLACIDVCQDSWGADIVVSAAQKGLMCPPGVGLASVGPKAWKIVDREGIGPRFYWDFRKARDASAKDETPFTPAVSLLVGLREALRMIHEEDLPSTLERHRRLATALRAGCAALELQSFPATSALSNSVTALEIPNHLDGGTIVRHMYANYGTVIAGSRNRLSGRVIRIGTMGHITEGDILTDLHVLEATLRDLGETPPAGAGVAAASTVLQT